MNYIENWLALGTCIYSRKTADAALSMLGLRKEIKRKMYFRQKLAIKSYCHLIQIKAISQKLLRVNMIHWLYMALMTF